MRECRNSSRCLSHYTWLLARQLQLFTKFLFLFSTDLNWIFGSGTSWTETFAKCQRSLNSHKWTISWDQFICLHFTRADEHFNARSIWNLNILTVMWLQEVQNYLPVKLLFVANYCWFWCEDAGWGTTCVRLTAERIMRAVIPWGGRGPLRRWRWSVSVR